MSAPSLDLRHIREIADAAVAGPWFVSTNMDFWVGPAELPDLEFNGVAHCGDIHWPRFREKQQQWEANATFIASARTWVPALVDRITELQTRLATAEGLLREIEGNDNLGWGTTIGTACDEDGWIKRRDAFLSNQKEAGE